MAVPSVNWEAIATVEALKGDLAESAVKLAQLEKEKVESDRALKQAERERIDAEKARLEIEQTEAAQKAAFALIAQLDTDKASLMPKLIHGDSRQSPRLLFLLFAC